MRKTVEENKVARYRIQGDVTEENYQKFKKMYEEYNIRMEEKIREIDPNAKKSYLSTGDFIVNLMKSYEENMK